MKHILIVCLGLALVGIQGPWHSARAQQGGAQVKAVPAPVNQIPVQAPPGAPGFPGQPGFPAAGSHVKELVPALIEALKDSDADVRLTAAATLVQLGHDAVPPLLEELKSKERESRANAAYLLAQMGGRAQEALPALIKAMKDEDKDVRKRVAYAIHRIVRENRGGMMPGMGPGMGGMIGPASFGGPGMGQASPSLHVPDPGMFRVSERGSEAKDKPPAAKEK